ncbi:MAG: 16S rRNA (guanine(527)-N(7))-methyltransferase RsmG [Anaerolineaceae bacterium]|nr:16S rRNA (guanine(527)-N(7))-methyltransferase RsmG [Anaerolineaceae bacterium]
MENFEQDVKTLLGIRLSISQLGSLQLYEQELLLWNKQHNLTAIRDVTGIRMKHFLDSLTCLIFLGEKPPSRIIDVGTGAGFPGIPLKIVIPNMSVTLVDSIGKKTGFCSHIVDMLGLKDVKILQARAEDIGHMPEHREKYDCAVARAVANLSTLVEYLLPLVQIGGITLAQKGKSGPAEAQDAEKAIHLMGGQLRQLRQVKLPGVVEERYLILIEKIAATPSQYPRRTGVPSKKPIK